MKQNKREANALFLPFMQISSGHHQVADALMNELQNCQRNMTGEKVDILAYSYGKMGNIVSATYLAWIKLLPKAYDWIYYHFAYSNSDKIRRFYLYELMFIPFFKRLVKEKQPSIVFCTHALPSSLASLLKRKEQLNALVVNVYTDYFVNRVWGVDGIDYHFVPTLTVKENLLKRGVHAKQIFVTGIPVHSAFHGGKTNTAKQDISILVTGGSLGIGTLERLLPDPTEKSRIHYYVLCGNNEKLYKRLQWRNSQHVTPFPYIASRKKMNELYDQADAVLTKPGGVTVSECLIKQKPIFIYNPLPGQEKINVSQLHQSGLIMVLDMGGDSIEEQMMAFFANTYRQQAYQQHVGDYHTQLIKKPIYAIVDELLKSVRT